MRYAKELFLSFILFSFLMFSSAVSGEESKILPKEQQGDIQIVNLPKWVSCAKQGIKLLDLVSQNYGEKFIATGDGDETTVGGIPNAKTQLIIMWNSVTQSYTIAEVFPDGGTCILMVGKDLTFLGKFDADNKGKSSEPEEQEVTPGNSDKISKKIFIHYDSNMPVNKPVH